MPTRIIDLSHPIHDGMPTFPVAWHPYVEVTQLGRHGIEARETRKIVLGTHTGTHVDAPLHFIPGGSSVDALPLELLTGPARLVDLAPWTEKQAFDAAFLARALGDEAPVPRLVLRTGFSRFWGTLPYFTRNPFLTADAAQFLIDRGVRLLGMDLPQIDSADHGRGCSPDSPNHRIMLGQGCHFVENLTNLEQLRGPVFEWIVAPLPLRGGDGATCRSLAIEEDP
jgi:kynurenine formamidase